MRRYFLFIFLFYTQSYISFGQELGEVFVIDDTQTIYQNLNQQLWLLDSERENLEEILKLDSKFIPYHNLKDSLKKNHSYWGKIIIHSPNSKRNWVLRLGIGNSKVKAYFGNGNEWQTQITGRHIPLYDKLIPEPKHQDLFLNLTNDSILTVYFRIENIENRKPDLDLQLIFAGRYYFQAKQKNLIQGVFLGIYLIMVLYNFLLFLSSKIRAYLYYSLYLIGIVIYNIYFNGYLIQLFIYN